MSFTDAEYAGLLEEHRADAERAGYRQALITEREQCRRGDMTDRVAAIDAELKRIGPAKPLPELQSLAERCRQVEADQDRQLRIAALVAERRGYEARGLADRVALVDAELARIDADAAGPRDCAETRPAGRAPRARR